MPSATRLFIPSMLITVTAAVTLMCAAPVALAGESVSTVVFAETGQPTTTQVNTSMTPVVVYVENSAGNPIASFNGPVTLTLTHAPGVPNFSTPGLTGNTVNASKGVATFPALTVNGIGFGFVLQASAGGVTSGASDSFDIVDQLVHCQSGQACQSETVSSQGTSGFEVASQASSNDVLTATGGGFPSLSCTTIIGGVPNGVVSFTFTGGSKTITMMLAKNLVQQLPGPGAAHFNICWGSGSLTTTFTTKPGTPLVMNNGEWEGLLPDCSASGPSPCITSRHKTKAGVEVITIFAPSGDPHISF